MKIKGLTGLGTNIQGNSNIPIRGSNLFMEIQQICAEHLLCGGTVPGTCIYGGKTKLDSLCSFNAFIRNPGIKFRTRSQSFQVK